MLRPPSCQVAEKHVSENVFSQYIYKTLPTANHLWAFKKNLCMQMALSGECGAGRAAAGRRTPGRLLNC